MANIEFRSDFRQYDTSDYEKDPQQLKLPLAIRESREVHWLNMTETQVKKLIGYKVVHEYLRREDMFLPKSTYIDTDDIAKLNDRQLRYALRFADAANAVGPIATSEYGSTSCRAIVTAVDDGVDSRFVDCTYSGPEESSRFWGTKQDLFMQNLHTAAPLPVADS